MKISETVLNLLFGADFIDAVKPVYLKFKENNFDLRKTFSDLDADVIIKAVSAIMGFFGKDLSGGLFSAFSPSADDNRNNNADSGFTPQSESSFVSSAEGYEAKTAKREKHFNLKKVAGREIYPFMAAYFNDKKA